MTTTNKPWRFEAKAGNSLEIFLYDDIGNSMWSEGTTAKSFVDDLNKAGPVSSINLRVNSPGGSVFDGVAIYNALLNCGAKVTAQVDGLAASIASVIIMAAEKISMTPTSMIMVHNPATTVSGDSKDMRKMADTMDKVRASMITAYQRHCDLTASAIGKMLDDETWMTAEEAVANGFASEVILDGASSPIAASATLSQYRNLPQVIAARLERKPDPEPYVRQYGGPTLEELDAGMEQLRLQRRLLDLKYGKFR
jgi:ATP-dependent Clp endopeptidase proteolytic subunit ClpP